MRAANSLFFTLILLTLATTLFACAAPEVVDARSAVEKCAQDGLPDACQTACQGTGHAPSCIILADKYAGGIGVHFEPEKAAELVRTACDLGDMQACMRLAVMYRMGDGVAVDAAKSRPYFHKARW